MNTEHISEDRLIALVIGESEDRERIQAHLSECTECQQTLRSIQQLRTELQQEELPEPNLETNWARLLSQVNAIPVVSPAPKVHWLQRLTVATTVCVLLVLLGLSVRTRWGHPFYSVHRDTASRENKVPNIEDQLAGIERLLVLVRHTDGPLGSSVRSEAATLVENNSFYVQAATSKGQVGVARVLENSGYLLTTIAHPTGTSSEQTARNSELNLDSTLVQVRILLQNEAKTGGGGTT
jgi:hypothetical protein